MAKRKLSSTQIYYRISLALLPIMLGLSLLYQAGIFIPTKIFPPCIPEPPDRLFRVWRGRYAKPSQQKTETWRPY